MIGRAAAFVLLVAAACCLDVSPGLAAGFAEYVVPDPGSQPLTVLVWYPTLEPVARVAFGATIQDVALNAPLSGDRLPLVVISHGTMASPINHHDLATALADAGFVVAAPIHTADNSEDASAAGFRRDLVDRPRHIVRTIDYMLQQWPGHANLDPSRIGLFGYSLGGLTALIVAGGTPELGRLADRCTAFPKSVECLFVRSRHGDQLDPDPPAIAWPHDPRVRAVVVAAPAVTLLFGPGDLANVHVPVQLWRGTADANVPDAYNTAVLRKELPVPPEEHVVAGADHYAFQAPCSPMLAKEAPEICIDPPGFDRAAFHAAFNRAIVDFFAKHLAVD